MANASAFKTPQSPHASTSTGSLFLRPSSGQSRNSSLRDSLKKGIFSAAVRRKAMDATNCTCWCCGTYDSIDIAHVFGKEDRQLRLWETAGLINFDPESHMNAVPLCKLCYSTHDSTSDPGFVFFPADLDFFLQFERNDKKRRSSPSGEDHVSNRLVPTAEQYEEHLRDSGLLDGYNVGQGGLYYRVFLHPFILGGADAQLIYPALSEPRQWHGSPSATLRRAFLVLGNSRAAMIDPDTRKKISDLHSLYFDHPNLFHPTLKGLQHAWRNDGGLDPPRNDPRSPKRPRTNPSTPSSRGSGEQLQSSTPKKQKCITGTMVNEESESPCMSVLLQSRTSTRPPILWDPIPFKLRCLNWVNTLDHDESSSIPAMASLL
ncbi:hypothetical protein N7454_006181 [Penicillium verhagenii]|nr:hypothetical protein N7454_006181 [Penicillium verhagenii]